MVKRNESNITQTFLVLNDKEYDVAEGDLIKFKGLEISVEEIKESIEVEISEKTESTGSEKLFLTMNGRYAEQLKDSQYREIRLDKTLPFVEAPKNAEIRCPEDQTYCKSDEVEVSKTKNWLYGIIAGLAVVFVILVYMLGKGSKGKTSVRNEFNDYRKNSRGGE